MSMGGRSIPFAFTERSGPSRLEEVILRLDASFSPPHFRYPTLQRARGNSDPAVLAVRYSIQFITDSIPRSLRTREKC